MKVVINTCYGGFGLSPKAVKRIAELKNRKCYFFKHIWKDNPRDSKNRYGHFVPISIEKADKEFCFFAFDIRDPNNLSPTEHQTHDVDSRDIERDDLTLVQVVEELGEEANGKAAKLKIVEIPDNVDYVIQEYDGVEWIAEKHRTWS